MESGWSSAAATVALVAIAVTHVVSATLIAVGGVALVAAELWPHVRDLASPV